MISIFLYIILFICIIILFFMIYKNNIIINKLIDDNAKLKRGMVLQELEIRKLRKNINKE